VTDRTTSPPIAYLAHLTRRVYASARAEDMGMTIKQMYTLASLRDFGALPQQTLCDVLRTTQNTVVAWLNELEAAGYVERIRDPDDRRKHNVALTPAGSVALEHAERELTRAEDQVLAPLDPDERAQLRSLIAKALAKAPP